MAKFECPHCSQRIDAPEELAGTNTDCPACGGAITVPALPQTAEPPPLPPAPTPSLPPQPKVYVSRDGETWGPYDTATLQQHVNDRKFLPTDLTNVAGSENWQPLNTIASFPAEKKKGIRAGVGCLIILGVLFLIAVIGSCPSIVSHSKELVIFSPLISKGVAYPAGSYAKGSIPSGEYAFISTSGGYYAESVNGEIIDNENFPSFGYVFVHGAGDIKTRGLLVRLQDLKGLGYSGAKQAYEALTNQSNYRYSGYYRVGTDIPAGAYTVESMGRAYVEINEGPVGNSDIIENDNFNGSKSITITRGQYLKLGKAELKGPY